MSKIVWDEVGERYYETGVSKGVLYVKDSNGYGKGVAWNGLTAVNESPSGAEATPLYADNIKYLNLMSNEEFGATIEAYTYPDEFALCNGEASLGTGVTVGQQKRSTFGFCYQTKVGNDVDPELGYKIHIVYGALASPSSKDYATVNDSPEAITFSFELTTTPVEVPNMKPTATIVIDSTKVSASKLAELEAVLYGDNSNDASLPLPSRIIEILEGKPVASIAVTTAPTKTSYTAGESFDPAGMVITATYEDETTAVVTDYTYSPTAALATTDTAITISLTSGGKTKTVSQSITVTAAAG